MSEQQGSPRLARLLLVVLAPLVFLGGLEAALALVGFGGRPPLFIERPGSPGWLETNPAIAQRYFPGRVTALAIDAIPFHADKPPGTLRLVVQGGSTAAGFPYGRFAGLAGMLDARLEAARPEQRVEVITTAMAAVNSYTLLDFVDEIIEIEPDAVLIYAGHNEYLGIFGAGSALTAQRSRAATRLHLRLGRFRTYQLLDLLIPSAAEQGRAREDEAARAGEARRGTLMAHAATSVEIPLDSPLYQEGIRQFEENLSAILAAYADAGIPVYVATVASNEVDQRPFVGGPLDAAKAEAFETGRREVEAARAAGEAARASERAEQWVSRFPAAAEARFVAARLAHERGEREAAREAYRAAKELDRLRFRAPEAINQVVRRAAQAPDVFLVDVQAQLEAQAPLGRVGAESMLEHLHPNARGYFLLADAFYQRLEQEGQLGSPPAHAVATRQQALLDMPLHAIDHLNAAQAVREITNDFPFTAERREVPYPSPRGPVEALAKRVYEEPTAWLEAMESLLQHHLARNELARASVVARVTARSLPDEAAPSRAAAELLVRQGRLREAVRYFERAVAAEPDDLATLRRLDALRARIRAGAASGPQDEPIASAIHEE